MIGNIARDNTAPGIFVSGGGYANNVLTGNNGGDANPQVAGGINLGHNVCGTSLCP